MGLKQSALFHKKQRAELPVMETTEESVIPSSRIGINDCPQEVLVKILSLCTLEDLSGVVPNVCTKWRRLSQDPEVWRNKKFCITLSCSDDRAIAMLRQMPQLRTVEMQRVVEPSVIEAVCDNCKGLTTLSAYHSQLMSVSLLERLAENCPNIQFLTVARELLLDEEKAETVARLRQLQSLEVQARRLSDSFVHLRPFAEGCPRLARLDARWNVHISVKDLKYFLRMKSETLTHVSLPWVLYNGRCVVPLLRECTSLRYLQLYGRVLEDDIHEFFSILSRVSLLHRLTEGGHHPSPDEVTALAFRSGSFCRLQVLDISDNYLDDSVVLAACVGCPELKQLYLRQNKITDKALSDLHRLTKLEVLDLSQCVHLRGEALQHVARVRKLRELLLDGLTASRLRPGLDCVRDMSALEFLSLRGMRDITSFPFQRLPANLRVLKLTALTVDVHKILNWLQETMPRLKVMRLRVRSTAESRRCRRVTRR